MAKSKKERKKDATAASAVPVTAPEKDDGAGVVGSVPPPAGAAYDPWGAGAGSPAPGIPQAVPAPGVSGWNVPPTPSMGMAPAGAPSPVMMSRPVSNSSKSGAWQSWGQPDRASKSGAEAQSAGGWTAAYTGGGWDHYDEEEESSEEEYPHGYTPHAPGRVGHGAPVQAHHQPAAPSNAWMSWGKTAVDAPPLPPAPPGRVHMTPQQRSQTLSALLSQPASPGFRPPPPNAHVSAFSQPMPPAPSHAQTDKKAKRQTGFFGGWGKTSKKPEPPAPAAAGGWDDAGWGAGAETGGAGAGAAGGWGDGWGADDGAAHNGGGGGWDSWGAADANDNWPTNTIWEEEEEEDITGTPRKVHFSPSTPGSSVGFGDAGPDPTSRTLAYATSPRATHAPRVSVPKNDSDVLRSTMAALQRLVDSNGAALMPVQRALFGRSRPAKDRIHWGFPPAKNARVARAIEMVHHLSLDIAEYGCSKFVRTRERGALFVNATYRHPGHPEEPALDWLPFQELQKTLDFTLQDSVAFSDPAKVVVVFVFLSSESGNSVAMWRIKVPVPPQVLKKYERLITPYKESLGPRENYVIYLEPGDGPPERTWRHSASSQRPVRRLSKKGSLKGKKREAVVMPENGQTPYPPAKKKKKWWNMFKIRW
ncbi:hypothetical protein HDZ31DRAFT_38826 [Schizophyllum fasciatum]